MSPIFKGRSFRYGDLCARLDITGLYEPVFRHHSRRSDVCLTLRPVSLPLDDAIVTACAGLGWTEGSPSSPEDRADAEKKVLEAVADSDAGQTFLGLIGDQPAFLTGVYRSLQHPISGVYPAREGDHILTLSIPPFPGTGSMVELSLSILQACLTHYFSYPAVEKVMARIDRNNTGENELYMNAGFRFLREVERGLRLYYHTGTGYLEK